MTVQEWERRSSIPLSTAALIFLGAYAWPILQPDLPSSGLSVCRAVTWAVWVLFAFDYLARLAIARERVHFMRANLVDLLIIALPVLRPLRLLRLIVLMRVFNRRATASLRGRVAVYVGGAVTLTVLIASLAELDAERTAPEANIQSFGDSVWWAATTVTTVGYGDRYPVSAAGRMIAAGLMLCGIALVGIVTASFATWLVERVTLEERETREDVADVAEELSELRAQMALLIKRLDESSAPSGSTATSVVHRWSPEEG